MARAPITPSSGTELLRPVASPVDTFVAPPRTNAMLDFAQSIAPLDRGLQEFLALRNQEQKEREAVQLRADFVKNNGEGIAEGVRRGIIPPHMSDRYVKGYKALQGEALGRRLRAGFAPVYDAWAGKNEPDEDGKAFDRLLHDYVDQNIGTDDPDIVAGAYASVMQLGSEAFAGDVEYRSTQARKQAAIATGAKINATIDDADEAGLASGNGTDYAALGDSLLRQREAAIASGWTGTDFDTQGMKLVAAKAVELQDPRLLDFFKRKVPGQEITYGDTEEGSALRQAATEKLETIARALVVEGDKAEEKERKARLADATLQASELIARGEPVSEELIAAGSKADPMFRSDLASIKANLAKGRRDDRLVMQIKRDIVAGGGMDAVRRALPLIESPEDLDDVTSFARSVGGDRDTNASTILGTASVRQTLGTLDARTKAAGSFLNPVTGTTNEGDEAMFDFREMVLQWAKQNPNASVEERETAVARMSKVVKDRLKPSADDPKIFEYDRDPAAVGGFENPYSPAPPPRPAAPSLKVQPSEHSGLGAFDRLSPEQQRAAVAEAQRQGISMSDMVRQLDPGMPAAAPSATASTATAQPQASGDALSPDAQRYLDGFSPEEQAKIRKGAEGRAGGLPAMLDHIQRSGMKPKAPQTTAPSGAAAPDGTPIDPIAYRPSSTSYAPDEPDEGGPDERPRFTQAMAESFLAAVMADPDGKASGRTITATATTASGEADPQTAHLLDLIGEEEAKGNYNAVFGNAGSKRDLSAFTLDDILGQQQAARRRGVRSTAIGKYQFIFKTLRGLKEEMGLDGSEAFTPELQDRMAVRLLDRRGYGEFREGRLSQRQFALRLSQEWASMPDPRTGRSYYAGDGLNASRLKTRDVYAALGFPMGGDA